MPLQRGNFIRTYYYINSLKLCYCKHGAQCLPALSRISGSGWFLFVPNLVVAVVIFILGWIIGSVLGRLVSQVVKAIRVDTALQSAGAGDVLSRAGFRLDSGAFIGGLVRWFFIIAFLVAAFDVLVFRR